MIVLFHQNKPYFISFCVCFFFDDVSLIFEIGKYLPKTSVPGAFRRLTDEQMSPSISIPPQVTVPSSFKIQFIKIKKYIFHPTIHSRFQFKTLLIRTSITGFSGSNCSTDFKCFSVLIRILRILVGKYSDLESMARMLTCNIPNKIYK